MKERKKFALNLKAERVRAGLTQEETAEKLGIARETYNSYESGVKIDAAMVWKLHVIFNCPIENFYMGFDATESGV